MKSPTVLGVLVTLALLAIAGSLALEDEIGLPQCRGSRDEEPLEYTCLEQVKWGKCNETWVIEGNYCEEACGRCEGRAAVPTSGPLETRARSALEEPPSSACLSGYGPPETALYVKGGLLEEESGIAASRANEGILWLHNDNYDKKHVIAVSVLGPNAGNIVYVLDLEGLPGINRYSDFEDIRYRSSFSSFLSLSLSLTLCLSLSSLRSWRLPLLAVWHVARSRATGPRRRGRGASGWGTLATTRSGTKGPSCTSSRSRSWGRRSTPPQSTAPLALPPIPSPCAWTTRGTATSRGPTWRPLPWPRTALGSGRSGRRRATGARGQRRCGRAPRSRTDRLSKRTTAE